MLSHAREAGSEGVSPKCGLSPEGSHQTSNFLKKGVLEITSQEMSAKEYLDFSQSY